MRCAIVLMITLALPGLPEAGAAQGAPPPGGQPAEAAAGAILGAVRSAESGEPIPGASIAVRSAPDTVLAAGGISASDGRFRIEGLVRGSYQVLVAALGFESVDATVVIGPGVLQAELGEIRLAPAVVTIAGVTVTGERNPVTFGADRNTYIVEDMPAASGGSAVDVLRSIPSVTVDGENRVSLRGQDVAVQINGRPVPMGGEQLGNFLAQIPADAVESVAVIANPSARYDPEGTAGILNIVLDQNRNPGINGSVNVGAGTSAGLNGTGSLGYEGGGLTLFGSYGFMRMERQTSGFNRTEYSADASLLEQETSGTTEPQSHTLTASAAFKVSEQGGLSTNLLVSQRAVDLANHGVLRQLDAGGSVIRTRSNEMSAGFDNLTLDYALAYGHAFQPRTNELTTEVRFTSEAQHQLYRFARQPLATQGDGAAQASLETNTTDERHSQWTFQSDWNRLFGDETRLEAGYKGALRRLDDELAVSVLSPDRNAYLPDPGRSSRFDHEERIHAVYGVLSRNMGRFDLQAGLRLERTATRFGVATTGETFDHDVGSYFPSAVIGFYPDDARQLKLSYSKRIQRPGMAMLNPVASMDDPLNGTRGNPHLRPEYTHAFEFGYQHSFERGDLQLSPYYRHTVDAVRGLRAVDADGASTTTYANVATSDSYGFDLNGSVRSGMVDVFGGVNALRQVTDAANLDTDLSNRGLRWTVQADVTVRINRTLDVHGFVMYSAPQNVEQGRISGMIISNAAIRQKLLGDQATVTLRVMNPVQDLQRRSEIRDPLFTQETRQRFFARGVNLTFSYNFGGPPTAAGQDEGHGG